MADPKENKDIEAADKEQQEEAKKEVVTVCTLNLWLILIALHEKALSEVDGKFKSGDIELTILNSAIEGKGGKDAKFYGAGQHIIAAIPKDTKGIDKNKVEKKDAVPALQAYVQWFVGPDLKDKVKENILKPLENGADGKVADNHKKKEDIEKSKKDDVAGEKYEKESTIFVPSFNQYLLTEDGEDEEKEEKEGKEGNEEEKSTKDKNKEDAKDVEGTPGEGPNTAQGWYVEYKLTIPGLKEHPIADALKSFLGDLVKNFGVKGWSLRGSGSGEHTIGGLLNDLDSIFGKMDASKFESEFNAEMKKRMKGTDALAKVWDTKTILKYLKNEVAHDKSKISPVQYALCVRVDKNDKSYKLFNEDTIANITNAAITGAMRGIIKKLKFGVKAKDVILVNNYKDNKKAKDNEKFDTDKSVGAVEDSIIIKNKLPILNENSKIDVKKLDLLDSILENAFVHFNRNIVKCDSALTLMKLMAIDESMISEAKTGGKVSVDQIVDFIKKKGSENILNTKDKYKSELDYVYKDDKFKATYLKGKEDMYKKDVLKCLDSIYAADSDDAMIKATNKVLADYKNGKGKGSAIILHAIYKVLDSLNIEDKKEDEEEIEITFIDKDPNEEKEDKEISKVKKEEGKEIEIPDPPEYDGWEFKEWDPNPEEMEESGETYPKYEKTEEDSNTVKITFYDADPETGDKLKEPLGDPIEIDAGLQINLSDEALKAFEKYNKQLESDKKDGYVFKGWNPDPSGKIEEDTDIVAKYIEEGEKDTKYKVMFLYAPDQEKQDKVEVIQVDGKDVQEVAAGEKVERPEVPEIEGYVFKDWGEDEKNLDNVQDNIVAIAQYQKKVMITPKAPKDPEKPDKDLEPIGDPIEYDPKKPFEKELPDPPEKKGWKPTGKWNPDPKDIKDPKEDIVIIPEYKKADDEKKDKIKLIFRVPKDPEKPDDTEIIGKKPIEYDPDLSIEDLAPQPPKFDGWHFKDWNPKLSEIKDPKDKTEIIALYEKGLAIKFKLQDPRFANKSVQNLTDAFVEINTTLEDIDDKKFPTSDQAKDIPEGYKLYSEQWLIPPYNGADSIASDSTLKDKIKKYLEANKDVTEVCAVLRLRSNKDFIIQVVDVDPEKPDDESQETDIAKIHVIYDPDSKKNIYKAEDLKKIADKIQQSETPDEKYADKIDTYIDENTEALKKVEAFKKSSKGDYAVDPKQLLDNIESKSKAPGTEIYTLPPKKRIVKVKTTYGKEQFRVKIINPDPEDPENTKSLQDIATITVFIQGDDKFYKAADLAKLAKDAKTKAEADKYNEAAKANEEAFKKVENVDEIAKSAPNNSEGSYKFLGWAGADGKTGKLEELIDGGPKDGENEIVIKASYENDIKAKHTDIDFYIVPMKGLKDKPEKESK